ncbi:PP2C family protein-serine/threonine phosphatase [Kitasatospora sp. NPDC059463]|uniref:PP2C family protein-serine/threonine phosphatase n=1 Tax=Kitasatospora sp. NPDC059463 TaxID=3346842 RepID=UPI00369064C6
MSVVRGSSAHPSDADRRVGATWGEAPHPVLVVDRHGTLVSVNRAGRGLLPGAEGGRRLAEDAPAWLAEAHRRVVDGSHEAGAGPLSGTIGDRVYEAHPTASADGDVVWWLVDDTDRRLAQEALRDARERSGILAEVSSILLSTLNVPRCMELTAGMAAEHLAEAAVLVAPAQGRRYPLTHALRGGPTVRTGRPIDPGGVPGLGEALRGYPPVPARWIDPAALPDWVVPDGFAGAVGSVIVTPLPGHGVPAGALILLRSSTEQAFTEGEEVFARLFAARAGAALSAARLYTEQAAVTATLVQELLPPSLHRVHGVDYAGSYRTSKAHERIGGDFYDVHAGADPGRETLVVLGDVAGKGLEAAVLTGKIRNTLHALLPLADDHHRVLELLNGALLTSGHTRFATLVLASVGCHDGQVRLRLTSAGHPPPLIVRADGRVEDVPTRGTLVGVLPAVRTQTVHTVLDPGDTCLLYTDGFTEARGGLLGDELWGAGPRGEGRAARAGGPPRAPRGGGGVSAAPWLGGGRHDDMAAVAISAPRTGAAGGSGTSAGSGGGTGHHR